MKRALIVTPYLDHLGGGERYMLEAASVIESAGYELHFAWDNLEQISKLTNLLDIKLKNPQLDTSIMPLYSQGSPLAMFKATREYDLVLYLSDGSIPLLGAKANIIHMQVPFHNVGGGKFATQLKLKRVNRIIVNSNFTKSVIDQEYRTNSLVIYPPVTPIKTRAKEKLILSVGRFEPTVNIKKQDILIQAFAKLSPLLDGWRLALAGGSSDDTWLAKLQESAGDLPIDFYPNLSYSDLSELYGKASIFWHGAGYQVDQNKNPDLVEHFGITTAEAITAGCVPLVIPKGGQNEVVSDQGLHWYSLDNLVELTTKVVASLLSYQNIASQMDVKRFSKKHFGKNLIELIS